MPTRRRKLQAQFRTLYANDDGKYRLECKSCAQIFYSYRPATRTCSVRCRKRLSRNTLKYIYWHLTCRTDPFVRVMADRHYSRVTVGHPHFTPPGKCLVLRTSAYNAFWVTSAPLAQFVRHPWAGAWTCTAFRNESSILSSVLIEQAVAVSLFVLKTPPDFGFITFVNAIKVNSSNPGYCFKKAGWKPVGFTKNGLHVLQLLPTAFPRPVAPSP